MAEHQFLNFLNGFITTAKEQITELAKTELANKDKKKKLDETIKEFVENALLDKIGLNFFVKLAIKKLVIPHIAQITQVIFDLLQARIDKVTIEPATKEPTQTKSKAKADEDAGENK